MAKSKELMAKNKRLSKEIESLKAADAAAAKKVATTEDYYKKQLRQHKQQDQQVEGQSDDEQHQKTDQQQKEAPPQRQQKKANPPQQQKKADPPQRQQKKANPPQQQKADSPQDVAPATLDYAYHKDGVGKAYKYWDSLSRTWGITPDYWVARQIGGDIWSVIWVWYSDGLIDHLLSVEEIKRFLP